MRIRIEAANGCVGIDGPRIIAASGSFDVDIRVPHGLLRPGLVNAHDHLHRNHYGRLGRPPYTSSYEWGADIHAHDAARIVAGRALPRRDALLCGAWKNLLSGVTTVVHHDAWEPVFDDDFPVRVAPLRTAHSLGLEPGLPRADGAPFAIHLAEGTDAASAAEVRELAQRGRVDAHLLAVHVVGVDADGIDRLRSAGAAVVWCPSSNEFLFGRTAPAALLAPGIDVLLGSDSLLTGTGSLLDEMQVARRTALVSGERLEAAVGCIAARRLGLPAPSLEVGARADVIVLARPLLEATDEDVHLVIAGGELRVLSPSLLPQAGALAAEGRLQAQGDVQRWIRGQAPLPERAFHEPRAASLPSSRPVRA